MWLTTWPAGTSRAPAYKEHHSEAAAEAHAQALIRSGKTTTAVVFEIGSEGISA